MGRQPLKKKSSSFFKFMTHDSHTTCFTKQFKGKIPAKIFVRSSSERLWLVELKKVTNHMYVENGWQDFVKDNFLKLDDVLLFKYDGNSRLNVKIFGNDSCEKENASKVNARDEVLPHNINVAERVEEQVYKGEYMQEELTETESCEIVQWNKIHAAKAGRERISKEALAFRSNHPYFVSLMRNPKHSFNIPKSFLRKTGLQTIKSINLQDPKGRLWPVKIGQSYDSRLCFGSGWGNFRTINQLRQGDSCAFEFIEGAFHVHIFRITEETESGIAESGVCIQRRKKPATQAANGKSLRGKYVIKPKDPLVSALWRRFWTPKMLKPCRERNYDIPIDCPYRERMWWSGRYDLKHRRSRQSIA
ncbi:hypothetical protein QJS10_CPA05g01544 [Acorus calamus]|uniref:TF-B3 domain-containing protein n=1 Tax=Acorus calamus TaxID=4465 RepID=A0AAV9ET18_ACOCL|nr:hypothetical protein QJS10_CPA05g01544 [Acorus calamus]